MHRETQPSHILLPTLETLEEMWEVAVCDIKRKKKLKKNITGTHFDTNKKKSHQIGLLIHMWRKSKPFLLVLYFCVCACYVRHSFLIQYMCAWLGFLGVRRLVEDVSLSVSLKVNSNILPARVLHFLNGNNQIQNIQRYVNSFICYMMRLLYVMGCRSQFFS